MRLRPALLAFALAAAACHRRRAHRPAAAPRWFVRPASGVALRVDATRFLRGALRVEGVRAALPPWPASALVAAASTASGAWLFASEDGTIYRAPSFTGPLRVAGALDDRAAAVTLDERAAAMRPVSHGALFVVDAHRRAWAAGPDGHPRRLPLDRVIHGAFVSRSVALAVVEPGALVASRDGGASFEPVAMPAGVALSVVADAQGAIVRGSAGSWRWNDGALAQTFEGRPPASDNAPDARAAGAFARAEASTPAMPDAPGAAAPNPDGTLALVRGSDVVTVDPRTGREFARVPAPGDECALARAGDGLRALCRHQGWATFVSALADGATTWTTLRDEARAEPVGRAFFDRHSRAWVVAGACQQRPLLDRALVCVYGDDGRTTEVRLPFTAAPMGFDRGVALVTDADAGPRSPTRAALVRGAAVEEFQIPLTGDSARTATFDDGLVSAWEFDPANDGLRALVRGRETSRGAWTWQRTATPEGARRGALDDHGRALVVGATSALVAESVQGGEFRPFASPARDGSGALAFDLAGPWYCAGPWCRLGGNATLSRVGDARAEVVAREEPPASPPQRRSARATLNCRPDGAATPAPDTSAGASFGGYAMRWQAAGESVSVAWYGALQGAAEVRWPGRVEAPVRAIGAVGAQAAAAVLERCGADGCDHAFVTPAGITSLGLTRAQQGAVSLVALGTRWVVRADDAREGVGLVTLVALAPTGEDVARRTFAVADGASRAAPGIYGGHEGLWVRTASGTLRFYPFDAAADAGPSEVTESHVGCAPDTAADGEVHLTTEITHVRGTTWAADPAAWHLEEVLRVAGRATCTVSVAGGDPRDASHRPPGDVRGFELRAAADDRFEGRVWAGARVTPLACAPAPR